MNPDAPSVTVVLGMHRSGTSALTGLLARMGFETGDKLLPANPHNPAGHFEDTDVLAIDERILGKLGAVWHCPVEAERLERAMAEGRLDAEREAARQLVQERIVRHPHWLVKEPRLGVLLPFWIDLFHSLGLLVRFVWIIRRPMEVAASLHARDGLAADHAVQLWTASNLAILRNLQGTSAYLLDYVSLLESPAPLAQTIAAYLGRDIAATDLAPVVGASIRPELHRSRSEPDAGNLLYRRLRTLEPGILDAGQMATLWREWAPIASRLDAAWSWAGRLDAMSRDLTQQLACGAESLVQTEALRAALAAENARLQAEVAAESDRKRQAQEQTRQAQEQARQAQEQTRQAECHSAGLSRINEQLNTEIRAIKASRSWRLTAPLRWIAERLR